MSQAQAFQMRYWHGILSCVDKKKYTIMMYNLSKIFIYKSGRVAKLQLESNKPSSYTYIPPKPPPEIFKNSDDFF